jgi:hypothetical protein
LAASPLGGHDSGIDFKMITFFAIPKPFKGHIATIQRNAIRSWTRLKPKCEILLFGDEEGTADIAARYDLRHISQVEQNEYGTPLISDVFKQAQMLASYDLLCYANADIIFLSDLIGAVKRVANSQKKFLMVGQRWDLDIDNIIGLDDEWEAVIKNDVKNRGILHPKNGIDYFLFTRDLFNDIPKFAVGRPAWDNWIIYNACTMGSNVIDSTRVVTAIHQNHDYSHVPMGNGNTYEGPEANQNRILAGDASHIFTLDDANYLLTKKFIIPFNRHKLSNFMNILRFNYLHHLIDK